MEDSVGVVVGAEASAGEAGAVEGVAGGLDNSLDVVLAQLVKKAEPEIITPTTNPVLIAVRFSQLSFILSSLFTVPVKPVNDVVNCPTGLLSSTT